MEKQQYFREVEMVYTDRKALSVEPITSSITAQAIARAILKPNLVKEHVVAIALDTKNKPIAWEMVGVGTSTYAPVDPKDVVRLAILSGAQGIILTHNHPSGDPTPSEDDKRLTDTVKACLSLFGVKLLDHIILGNGYYSFCDHGLIG